MDDKDLPPWEAHPEFPGLRGEELGEQYELNLAHGSPRKSPFPLEQGWTPCPIPPRLPKGADRAGGAPPSRARTSS